VIFVRHLASILVTNYNNQHPLAGNRLFIQMLEVNLLLFYPCTLQTPKLSPHPACTAMTSRLQAKRTIDTGVPVERSIEGNVDGKFQVQMEDNAMEVEDGTKWCMALAYAHWEHKAEIK